MATIKSFTDLPQSKVLAKFLPLESADMYWSRCTITDFGDNTLKVSYAVEPCNISQFRNTKEDIPCWSLAALLGVLPVMIDYKGSLIRLRFDKGNVGQDEYAIWYDDLDNGLSTDIASESKNLVDACYEMILKLHELNLL